MGDAIGLVALSGFPCPFFETDGRVVLVSSCRRELQLQPAREREREGGETGRRERIYTDLFFPIGGPGVQVQREAGRSCGFGESNSNPNHYRERKRCPSRA